VAGGESVIGDGRARADIQGKAESSDETSKPLFLLRSFPIAFQHFESLPLHW
jgi:hypothetical protein